MTVSSVKTGYDGISLLVGNAAYDPAATFLIQRATGTGSSSTISFTSIPSTYKHLQIRGTIKYDGAGATGAGIDLRFNSDSTAVYAAHYMYGDGSTVSAAGVANSNEIFSGYFGVQATATNVVGTIIIDIHDYANTSKFKTTRTFGGSDYNYTGSNPGYLGLNSGLWRSTSAISSLQLSSGGSGNFTTQSTFALYGMVG
jgi:hypothetical protein